jgi:hypothetical protein
MRLALRPKAEAEQRLAELAAGDSHVLDVAHRDLCRRLGSRPDDIPAAGALRLVHALRDRLRADASAMATREAAGSGSAPQAASAGTGRPRREASA